MEIIGCLKIPGSMLALGACDRVKRISKAHPQDIANSPIIKELLEILSENSDSALAASAMAALATVSLHPTGRQRISMEGAIPILVKLPAHDDGDRSVETSKNVDRGAPTPPTRLEQRASRLFAGPGPENGLPTQSLSLIPSSPAPHPLPPTHPPSPTPSPPSAIRLSGSSLATGPSSPPPALCVSPCPLPRLIARGEVAKLNTDRAVGLLMNLAADHANRRAIRDIGGIEALVGLMKLCQADEMMEHCMGALHNAMLTDNKAKGRAVDAGVLGPILQVITLKGVPPDGLVLVRAKLLLSELMRLPNITTALEETAELLGVQL
ncbi:MAG: hypothetical protein WDW38_004568 [Sanguina aurantia]